MDFYGDNTRWFFATVIEKDPEERGRFKIRVAGLHSETVDDKFLPFAQAMVPTTEGGTSGIGQIPQLEPGAFVYGVFLDGRKSQSPLILGSVAHKELPSSVQIEEKNAAGGGRVGTNATSRTTYLSRRPVVILDGSLVDLYAKGNANTDVRRMIIMQFLVNNGLSVVAAAGVTGNLEEESTFVPTKNNKTDNENSWGLAQWNDDAGRLQPLIDYANNSNKDWLDFFVQLEFLIVDMKTNSNSYHRVWSHLFDRSKTLDFCGGKKDSNATWYFFNKFEIGNPQYFPQREKLAFKAYDQWRRSKEASVNNSKGSK